MINDTVGLAWSAAAVAPVTGGVLLFRYLPAVTGDARTRWAGVVLGVIALRLPLPWPELRGGMLALALVIAALSVGTSPGLPEGASAWTGWIAASAPAYAAAAVATGLWEHNPYPSAVVAAGAWLIYVCARTHRADLRRVRRLMDEQDELVESATAHMEDAERKTEIIEEMKSQLESSKLRHAKALANLEQSHSLEMEVLQNRRANEIQGLKKRNAVEREKYTLPDFSKHCQRAVDTLARLTLPAEEMRVLDLAEHLNPGDTGNATARTLALLEKMQEISLVTVRPTSGHEHEWDDRVALTYDGRVLARERTSEEISVTGDFYQIGNSVGPVGPGGHMTMKGGVQQQSATALSDMDLARLAEELRTLRDAARREEDLTPENDESIAALGYAQIAAESGDRSGVVKALRKAGSWALRIGEGIGMGLAVQALKESLL